MTSLTSTVASGDALYTALSGLQSGQAQLEEAAAAVAASSVEASQQNAEQSQSSEGSSTPFFSKSVQVFDAKLTDPVVRQLIFSQMGSVSIAANAAVVRAAYESSSAVQRIVGRAQGYQTFRERLA